MSDTTSESAQDQNTPTGGDDMPKQNGTDQLAALRAENAEMKDKYLRAIAEMDNIRKQAERRSLDRTRQEKKALLLRVIEVVDDLGRALSYQDVSDRDSLLNALRLTYNQLGAVLQREGVTTFVAEGEAFDPHVHEAIEAIESHEVPEGHVAQEVQRGYRYGDELLRPARVHVSAGRPADPPQD